MVRLREIARTAAFAWSPDGASKPLMVTGTRAGAVDADFSDETTLEVWDLNLDNQEQGLELQPIASITTDSRFYDIAWGLPSEDYPNGIIAGALENGSLDLWDAKKLIAGDSDTLIARTTKHTGAIKSLHFNPLRPTVLATAGAKGELFIYDVTDPSNAFRLGTTAARSDDLECVAWNQKVAHILATGGSGGFVTVWDLKTKKASLTLNNNRKPVSAIAWDPSHSTKLLTATPDDNTPVILLWDLRNSNAPERTLTGHEQGVLSLSWCEQDADLLLSCGKDNRTLIWNPQTGERYGEFPEVTNWTFLTRFHPYNPDLSATASFDGKITIQTLQNTNPAAAQSAAQKNLDGEDFFTQAQTQPQGAAFSLVKAPKWYERPVGVSFGFGGKLIIFKETPATPGHHRGSKVQISQFSVDSDITSATEKFEDALKSGDIASICEAHKEEAKSDEEKADWLVLKTLLNANPRPGIIDYLGVSKEEIEDEPANGTADHDHEAKEESKEEPKEELKEEPELKLKPTKPARKGHKKNRLSVFFSEGPEGEDDDFLASLSATKGAKTNNPFTLFKEGEMGPDRRITRALMLGQFAKAVTVCLEEERMADAFMIAHCGGQALVDKVQAAYLSQKTGMPAYLRLLGSVIVKNLWDVVYNADLSNWKETMVTLCTFAEPSEFPDLCDALGDRIFESGSRQDACFCYLVGSKLEKVVGIWISELQETEKAGLAEGNDSVFSIHARSLQHFVEKVTVFRQVTKFQDSDLSRTSGWRLAELYDKYTEYADIVAAQGQLAIAQKYLDLLPSTYPAAEVTRNRLRQATQKKTPHPVVNTRSAARSQPHAPMGYNAPQPASLGSPMNPYASPAIQNPPQNPYAPRNASPYQPAGYQPSQPVQQNPYAPSSNLYGASSQTFPPPRNTTPSRMPPPPRNKEAGNWNDVPMVSRPPPARRSTPSTASPFPNQGNQNGAPPSGPYGPPRSTPTPPPPPKGPAPPRMTSPLGGPPQVGNFPPQPRPSSAAREYAPSPSAHAPGHGIPPPPMANMVARTASPYNPPPPAAGPPTNRYAPAPAPQASQPPQHSGLTPPGNRPPPSNPYAPQAAPSPYAPSASTYQAPPPPQGPPHDNRPPSMSGPPMGGPPMGGPPPAAKVSAPPPPRARAPSKPKYPAGDRSHIPGNAQHLVEILSQDMQRVAMKAPKQFEAQVKDAQKRLNILFDHLNNEDLVKPDTIEQLNQLAEALEAKNYPEAQRLQVEIQRDKLDECGNWMVGVKRLISMSKNTP